MRDVVLREEFEDGATRETLACGHVLYLTKGKPGAMRRCSLCNRSKGMRHVRRRKPDRRA